MVVTAGMVASKTMTSSNKETLDHGDVVFWRILRGEAVYRLDESSTPKAINEILGPDPLWTEAESIMCFDDLEVGLDETNERKHARYFGLYPGKTKKNKIILPNKGEASLNHIRMDSVLSYLVDNSVSFTYDKTLDSGETDRGVRLGDGGSVHFYKRRDFFYLGSVFLKKI